MSDLIDLDYKLVQSQLKNKSLRVNGETMQYSIEQRGRCLHIVENNFKPNTTSSMSIPLPVYNKFVKALHGQQLPRDGLKANSFMGLFRDIYEEYRRDYLGATEALKPSSYNRYASILYLLWKCTEGQLGFTAQLIGRHTVKTVQEETGRIIIDSEIISQGYFIKPSGQPIVRLIDKEQTVLLQW